MVVIGYDLDSPDLLAIKIDIYDMDQTKVGVDACDTFSIMSFVIASFVEILIFVDTFSIVFAEINVDFYKLSKFEYNYINNNDIIVTMDTLCTIGGAAIVIEFLSAVIFFVIQLIDKSSLNIMWSIESHAIIIGIVQVVLYLGAESSIDAKGCNTQVMHNVCAVFVIFFIL